MCHRRDTYMNVGMKCNISRFTEKRCADVTLTDFNGYINGYKGVCCATDQLQGLI